MNELMPCPFCGGEAELHFQPVLTDQGVCVHCTNCKTRSKFVMYDCKYVYYRGEKDVYVPKEWAVNYVKELWNRRVRDDQ